jgi:hypothetical protein
MPVIRKQLLQLCTVAALVLVGACATSQKEMLPERTEDGLVLVEGANAAVVYRNPDADLSGYNRVFLADVQVAFRKDWLRDQNRDSISVNRRLTQEDADRIKAAVAQEFRRIFTDELEKGGYPVATELNGGKPNDDLLVLVPAIVDLDVTAPDVPAAGRSRTYTASNGSMTLYLEFRDAITGDVIGKVADSQSVRDRGYMNITNSVTNKAEADRMLRRWASLLVQGLDRAHGRN